MIPITPEEVGLFSRLIHDRTGIFLDLGKAYLLENRLAPLLEEAGAESFTEFFRAVSLSPAWVPRVIDAITTNETSFFRDQRPFSLLQEKLLPGLIGRRRAEGGSSPPALRVWSAACSTGQEAYSIGMVISELLGPEAGNWQVRIIGTDISKLAVVRANEGVYSRFEVDRGVPDRLRDKYFTPQGERLQVCARLRAISVFMESNLLAPPSEGLGKFDLVFCRNVGIYFNQDNRRRLYLNIARHLRPDGALFIGATESLLGVCDLFVRRECANAVYFQPSS